uniref:DUF8039 domain-containing protein n=1 Tax=Noccaea caerulescens TaxID=107243 RepID=A0A1J3DKH8_NOCCA
MCSTDPKALLNNIPLGPNAAIVKIDVVFKEAVYLWRPTSEMLLVTDALGVEIAWPIDKVELVNLHSRDESVKGSPGSGSTSSASKKGAKTKCILLDCNNSGDKVAEGRLCSTDPTALVHFKPLGPNASKVWVEVSKIGDAKVWRPNEEITYISDAIGTTVAWPNDKIVYL